MSDERERLGDGPFAPLAASVHVLSRIVRARPLAPLAAILTALLVPSCACLFGFVLVPGLAARGLRSLRSTLDPSVHVLPRSHFVVAVSGFFVGFAALAALPVFTPLVAPLPARIAVSAAACAGLGALYGLVAGAPFHSLGGASFGDALARALGDSVRVGLRGRGLAGAVIALVTLAPPLAYAAAAPAMVSPHEATLWFFFLMGVGQGVALLWFFALGVPVKPDAGAAHESTRRVVMRILALSVPVAGVVACALVFAAARPSLAHSLPTSAERATSHGVGALVSLPGVHGLRVERQSRGVSIAAADGGGVGAVDFDCSIPAVSDEDDLRYSGSQAGGWIVYVRRSTAHLPGMGASDLRGVRFDGRGVRTDDGIVERIAQRFGLVGLVGLLLAFVLAIPFFVVVGRSIGNATTLDLGSTDGAFVAWSGALDIDDGASIRVDNGRLQLVASARLVRGGDGVVALAHGALALGQGGPLEAGAAISIVAPRRQLASLGPRTGAVPWPADAWLVVGSLEAARERIVGSGLRSAALFGVPAALLALVACAVSG